MKKLGIISIFIFLTGLFAGIFFSTNLSDESSRYLSTLLLTGISVPSSGFFKDLFSSLLSNATLALIMLPALFSRFLCPLPFLVLGCKSFAIGFCSGLVYLSAADKALVISLFKLFPQNLFFVPAFLMLSAGLFYWSAAELSKKNRPSHERKGLQRVIFLACILLVCGAVTEAICRPAVL